MKYLSIIFLLFIACSEYPIKPELNNTDPVITEKLIGGYWKYSDEYCDEYFYFDYENNGVFYLYQDSEINITKFKWYVEVDDNIILYKVIDGHTRSNKIEVFKDSISLYMKSGIIKNYRWQEELWSPY